MSNTKKGRVLFYGWETFEQDAIMRKIQKYLEDFDMLFAYYDIEAMDTIAELSLVEKNPVTAIIFRRMRLVVSKDKCKLISDFAAHSLEKREFVAINFIWNDQDVEGRNAAVSAHYAPENNWEIAFTIINGHIRS